MAEAIKEVKTEDVEITKDAKFSKLKAKGQKKISFAGKGSKDGYFYLKKGDSVPKFMTDNLKKYEFAIGSWFE